MPLQPGSSRATISHNISELEHSQTKAGQARSHKQNIAIALSEARRTGNGNGPTKSQRQDEATHQGLLKGMK